MALQVNILRDALACLRPGAGSWTDAEKHRFLHGIAAGLMVYGTYQSAIRLVAEVMPDDVPDSDIAPTFLADIRAKQKEG